MTAFGIVFYGIFGLNVFLSLGLVPNSVMRADAKDGSGIRVLVMLLSSIAVSLASGLCSRFLLVPFRLTTLEPLVFAAIVISAMSGTRAMLARAGGAGAEKAREAIGDVLPSAYLYAVVAWAVKLSDGFLAIALSALSSALGYYAAVWILDRILDRLDIERVPELFRGRPIRFITAALMALAFSGFDKAALSRIVL